MKKLICIAASLLTFVTLLTVFPTDREAEIYDNTIRLRVIANSDGEEDQRVKLLVRDAILAYVEEHYGHLTDQRTALAAIETDRERLSAIASAVLAREGFSYGAAVWVGRETYGRRAYESFAMPAGNYLSVQIRLGEARGENWWCVLFPPLCLGGALRDEPKDDSVPVGLSTEQYELITSSKENNGRYRVKFRVLEILADLFGADGY